jgi:hypothetical protein
MATELAMRAAVLTEEDADALALASPWGDLLEDCEEHPAGWYYALVDGRALLVARDGALRLVGAEEVGMGPW